MYIGNRSKLILMAMI